jgi:hypothetical protein
MKVRSITLMVALNENPGAGARTFRCRVPIVLENTPKNGKQRPVLAGKKP